ncbi:MAG: hypothetical protein V3V89_02810 [Gammaproteobacteria bacterium]
MFGKKLFVGIFILCSIGGCTTVTSEPDEAPPITTIHVATSIFNIDDIRKDIMKVGRSPFIEYPEPSKFSICYGHTCQYYAYTSLVEEEWSSVRSIFKHPGDFPEQEREQISNAIALLEKIVGDKTNTANDKGKNFPGLGLQGQMDCVDESTNTTVYLTMLQNDHLLKWHAVDHRISRGILTLQIPHFTAVIREKTNKVHFAVDSWFLDNGKPPFIVPLKTWQGGWKPNQ